jgi:hypothetical protein
MKKHLLIAAASLLSLTAFSQITVNRSDFAAPGDWFVLATDTTIDANTATALRVSGANKTWSLTGWAKRHNVDTTFYADGFTYPAAPAGCNLVSFERDPNTQEEFPTFMMVSNTAWRVIMEAGQMSGSGGAFKVFSFPSTMGTKFVDSVSSFIGLPAAELGIEIPFVDSVRITYVIKNNSEIDAYGNLILDAGTIATLRQKSIMDIKVGFKIRNTLSGTWTDLPGGGGLGGFNESTKTYTWVSANGGHPLLQVVEDTAGMVEQIDYVLASSKGLSSKLAENNGLKAVSNVFPVPSSEQITIEWTATQKGLANVVVYDILGNVVVPSKEYGAHNGLNQINISVNELKPGVYFYSLTGDGFERANRFVVGR